MPGLRRSGCGRGGGVKVSSAMELADRFPERFSPDEGLRRLSASHDSHAAGYPGEY